MIHSRRIAIVLLGLATATGSFAGCGEVAPSSGPSASQSSPAPSPSTSPSPSASASDVLLTISATTKDKNGAPVSLLMTVHASQVWDAPGRESVKDTYIELCTALGGGSVSDDRATLNEASLAAYGSTLLVIDTESEPRGHGLAGPIDLDLGSQYYYQVAEGPGLSNPNAAGCYGGYQISSTGKVTSITNYETGNSEPDLFQWRTGRYGFTSSYRSSAVLTDCTITLTQLAIDAGVKEVDGWGVEEATPTECATGYQGE
jgi:hypothetical protein